MILQATVKNHVGIIAIDAPLTALPTRQQLLALGQLAMTANGVGATKGIEITVAGVAQPSLLPSGETATIITASDYRSLLNS